MTVVETERFFSGTERQRIDESIPAKEDVMRKDPALWIRWKHALLTLSAVVLGLTGLLSPAFGIPAWSRRYDVPCSTCHYPTPPRLNAFGHKFRRAQYRNEEDFNKDPDWKKLGDYVAMRIRGGYQYTSSENAPLKE